MENKGWSDASLGGALSRLDLTIRPSCIICNGDATGGGATFFAGQNECSEPESESESESSELHRG